MKKPSKSDTVARTTDVENHYRLFLGRLAESDAVVTAKVGEPLLAMPKAFITSGEFAEQIFWPMVRQGNWSAHLYRYAADVDLRDWIATHFARWIGEPDKVISSTNWHDILHAVFLSGRLVEEQGNEVLAENLPAFLTGLRRASASLLHSVGSLDTLRGSYVTGWVWDRAKPNDVASVEFLLEGQVIHTAKATVMRNDVHRAGFGHGLVGFEAHLPVDLSAGKDLVIHARLAGSSTQLDGSPKSTALPSHISRWLNRKTRIMGASLEMLRSRLDRAVGDRMISIVMPVYNVRAEWLEQALDSVRTQWCSRWELLCIDDASPTPHVREILSRYAALDPRIRPIFREKNGGIARATNDGIARAGGDYIAFMDHDDQLEPNAVYHLLAASKSGAELIYSDEILTQENIDGLLDPQNRPAFSWDYYVSHPYFVHMVCVQTDIARHIGGLDETMTISADVDFVLRAIEHSISIAHVPAILYRWRTHETSTGHTKKEEVTAATLGALNRHLKRKFPGARASATPLFNQYRVDFPDDHGKTLIVIPTKNGVDLLRTCINSIRRTTKPDDVIICIVDHDSDERETRSYLRSIGKDYIVLSYSGIFNYAKINNHAVREVRKRLGWLPRYVLFANNDIEAVEAGWLERMRSLAGRPDVGIVGATLLYANRTIQHSGVILGLNGSADHAHKFSAAYNKDGSRIRGHLQSLVSTREYSAVTAACIIMRTAVFESVAGFDERFAVGFNDTDLCLRVGEQGLKILNDAESILIHHESATRSTSKHLRHPEDDDLLKIRWGRLVYGGDPFYSPLLSAWGISHQVEAYSMPCVKVRVREGLARYPLSMDDRSAGTPVIKKRTLWSRFSASHLLKLGFER